MTLHDFLNTNGHLDTDTNGDYLTTDAAALSAAQAYSVIGTVSKNDALNHDAVHDVEKILRDTIDGNLGTAELRKTARVFLKILDGVLDTINIGDAVTQSALDTLVAAPAHECAYTQAMRDHIEGMAKTYPLANTTLADIKSIRYAPSVTQCDHGAQSYVVALTSKALFTFTTTLTEDCNAISLNFRWREDGAATWKEAKGYPIKLEGGTAGQTLSQVVKRPAGLEAARHFQFEYTPEFVGQIASVAVSAKD